MNRRHFGIATLLGLTLALIVILLLLPQVALGKDSASVSQADAPLQPRRDDGVDKTADLFLPTDKAAAAGIYGQVTYQGNPIEGISLQLQLCDYTGSSWMCSTRAYTTTQADGSYQFTGAPSLGIDQMYRVTYRNSGDPNYVWGWWGPFISSYTAGSAVAGSSFDIANIPLLSPANDVTVTLPYTFEWTPRSATPSDIYEFDLHDSETDRTWMAPVSHTGSYTLEILPTGFISGTRYAWNVWVNSPDGGVGASREGRWVTILGPTYEYPHAVYLPIVSRPPGGINGRITYQGNPVSNISLDLRFYDGTSWSTKATVKTQSDGTYQFASIFIFSLQANQKYKVRYLNTQSAGNVSNPNYLLSWFGPDITSYRAGANAAGGDADIANISSVAPADNVTVSLPCTFQWTPRAATPSDSYGVYIEGVVVYKSFESGPLGYVSNYTLHSLSPALSAGDQYDWAVVVYTPGGGLGYSRDFRFITFSGTGLQAGISQPDSSNSLDLERLMELRKARGR